MNKLQTYVSLHNHDDRSNYRLVDSINKPELLIDKAHELGLIGLAITNHACLSSHMAAEDYMEKKKYEGLKLIRGDEIYLCRNGLSAENFDPKKDSFYHFILLAKDPKGHEQLRKLSTQSYLQSFMRTKMRRVPTYYSDIEKIVGQEPGHIVASTACIGSYIGKMLLKVYKGEEDSVEVHDKLVGWCHYLQSIFGEQDFYLELQPSLNKEQLYVNKHLLLLSDELNIPAIITTDSHMLSKDERDIHRAYLNSKDGDREVDDFYASAYMMGAEEIYSYMSSHIGEERVTQLLQNTIEIGNKIEDYSLKQPFRLPYIPSQEDVDGVQSKIEGAEALESKEVWARFINSEEVAERVFIKRIIDKCNSDPILYWAPERIARMEIELETVWNSSRNQKMVWAKYFLQVADYVKIFWEDGDTIVAPGRGSGVSFYLNYLLDIIQVDPMRESAPMLYWRFLNPERASILDIDTDIASNRRNNCIEALQKKYGTLRVVRVATEKTEGSKSAILTAARGLGISDDIAKYIASFIESDRGLQRSLHDTYYGNEDEGFAPNKAFVDEINKYPDLWRVAQRIEGLVCGQSSHAGGVNIYDRDITCSNSVMRLNSGEMVTAFDLHKSEEVGDVKIDLLATDCLTRIRTCLDLLVKYGYVEEQPSLRETYENVIGIYNLNRTDPAMWEAVAEGKIVNAFQFV